MTKNFLKEYHAKQGENRKSKNSLLMAGNPNKFKLLQYLINYHKEQKDKI